MGMQIEKNKSLKALNTFGIDVKAAQYVCWNSVQDVIDFVHSDLGKVHPQLIIGGGSNMLLVNDLEGVVIQNNILGKEVLSNAPHAVKIKVGGGEVWHSLVLWTLAQGWNGLENLSLIPGSVGAAPIQNIGAYGVELKDVFESLEAVHLTTGKLRVFTKEECQFGYRQSIFKEELKGQYAIVSVTFQLKQNAEFNTSYGTIMQELEKMGVTQLSAKSISDAVISIRKSKLPDPLKLGNSGSFFKNPIIPTAQYEELLFAHPGIPGYPAGDGFTKVPAGWLIEQSGWKGKRVGNCGSHAKQALVLVNYGGATGQEIFQLSETIIADVIQKYGVELEREVNIIG